MRSVLTVAFLAITALTGAAQAQPLPKSYSNVSGAWTVTGSSNDARGLAMCAETDNATPGRATSLITGLQMTQTGVTASRMLLFKSTIPPQTAPTVSLALDGQAPVTLPAKAEHGFVAVPLPAKSFAGVNKDGSVTDAFKGAKSLVVKTTLQGQPDDTFTISLAGFDDASKLTLECLGSSMTQMIHRLQAAAPPPPAPPQPPK
jgi:invasion protein IalB